MSSFHCPIGAKAYSGEGCINCKMCIAQSFPEFREASEIMKKYIQSTNQKDERPIGQICISALHDPNHALYLADNVVMVNGGNAVKGKTEYLMNEENMDKLYNVRSSFMNLNNMRYMTVDYRNGM